MTKYEAIGKNPKDESGSEVAPVRTKFTANKAVRRERILAPADGPLNR